MQHLIATQEEILQSLQRKCTVGHSFKNYASFY